MLAIANAKLRLLPDALLKQFKRADGSVHIRGIPSMEDVKKMKHAQLMMVLRECPASDYFGQSKVKLNERTLDKKRARMHAVQIVRQVNLQLVEKRSEEEKGQSSFGSGSMSGHSSLKPSSHHSLNINQSG